MASCKDCVHADMCRFYTEELAKAKGITLGKDIFEYFSSGDVCEDFKDRSRFVELPCVGDKAYELCRINQFGDYKIVESEIRGFIVDTNGTTFDYELLGERFFLTHEEAEQALKERENNG